MNVRSFQKCYQNLCVLENEILSSYGEKHMYLIPIPKTPNLSFNTPKPKTSNPKPQTYLLIPQTPHLSLFSVSL